MKKIMTLLLAGLAAFSILTIPVLADDQDEIDTCSRTFAGTDVIQGCYTVVWEPEDRYLTDEQVVNKWISGTDVRSFVGRFYKHVLHRKPEMQGLIYWSGVIVSNTGNKGALYMATKGFFHSKEFLGRRTTNEQFIDICYKAFLGRNPEARGKQFWLNRLNEISRDKVLEQFSVSTEFKRLMKEYLPD